MADCRAKNARVVVFVGPYNDGFGILCRSDLTVLRFALLLVLKAVCESLCGWEYLNVVVKLFVDGCPVAQRLGDLVILFGELDRDRCLRAVTAGLNAEVVKPKAVVASSIGGDFVVTCAIAMHRAVQVDARDAVAVGSKDAFDCVDVGHRCGAFVMNNDVVTLGVVGIAVNCERWVGGRIVGVDLSDDNVSPSFESFFEDALLAGVGVTATAGDQEHL